MAAEAPVTIQESFTIESHLRPDDLLRRLQADAADWREFRLSEAAREAGMYGFAFRAEGNAFRIRPKISSRGHYAPVYDGVVVSAGTGSRIRGSFRFARSTLACVALWLCGSAITVLWGLGALTASMTLLGVLWALVIAIGLISVCALWTGLVLRYAWTRSHLAREETRALLVRVSTAPAAETPSR